MVRCKFKCVSVTNFAEGARVELFAVSSGSPENEQFFKWTPNAKLEMQIINPEAAKQFVPGKEYYIDILEAVEVPQCEAPQCSE